MVASEIILDTRILPRYEYAIVDYDRVSVVRVSSQFVVCVSGSLLMLWPPKDGVAWEFIWKLLGKPCVFICAELLCV